MQTDISVNNLPNHEASLDLKADLDKDQPLEFTDWSSVDDIIDLSSNSSNDIPLEFKPIKTNIFNKASRKWLNLNNQNFFSQPKNISEMNKDQIFAGKALQAFENYLSIVCLMYFGDPFTKVAKNIDVFRPGKRSRSKLISDPLSMLISPLRAEHDFESWSPKQIAIFESSLCTFGKKFHMVEEVLGRDKSQKEITSFYYMWKRTSHYKVWKEAVREQGSAALSEIRTSKIIMDNPT